MSRDKIFEHCRSFTDRHPQLKDKAFIVLNACLKMHDDNVSLELIEDRLVFGLNLLLIIDRHEFKEEV